MTTRMLPLQQGSKEWLEFRKSRRNASESSAIMGCDPWVKSWKALARAKRGEAQPPNAAMQRGHTLEPIIRSQVESATNLIFEPCVMTDGDYSASLDGLTLDAEVVLEIKAPGQASPIWDAVRKREVADHYRWQLQHQFMVSGARYALFAVGDGEAPPILITVYPEPSVWPVLRAKWDEFWPLMSVPIAQLCDYLQRDDPDWRIAAEGYRRVLAEQKRIEAEVTQARERLVALTDGLDSEGEGLRVQHLTRTGNINYQHADIVAALSELSLDKYRGKSSRFWQIREIET